MSFVSRSAMVLLSLACAGVLQANVAPPRADQVKSELWSYFQNIEKNSPTVLGGLSTSSESMTAIKQRIDSMSDREVAQFQKMMAEAPDWKVAPEAFAAGFPPEMLDQIRKIGGSVQAEVPASARMREDVRLLADVLRKTSDAKLNELGIDRRTIETLEATLNGMDPVQLAMLQRRATDWRSTSSTAIQTLPAAFRRGSMALAKHGALSEQDIEELNAFRTEILALMVRIEALPREARAKLKVGSLLDQVRQLKNAPPDVLFMVRHNVPPQMLHQLRNNVAFLEGISRLTDEQKQGLEGFRGELAEVFRGVSAPGTEWAQVDQMLAGMPPEHLFLLEKQMQSFGEWQTAMPAVYQTLLSPELQARVRAVEGPNADVAVVAELEHFRGEALAWMDAAAVTSGVDAAMVARARESVALAPLRNLEVMRMAATKLPPSASDAAKISVALMNHVNFSCSISVTAVPEVCFPEICADPCLGIDGGCEVCTPAGCTPAVVVTANFDLFCNPVESAIHDVATFGQGLVNTMQSAIQTAITTMQTAINNSISAITNTVDTIVSAIVSTVNDVWAFVQTLPDKAWDAIKAALNLLLDIEIRNGITVRDLVGRGVEHAMSSMRTLFGLAEGWWSTVAGFTLPTIPCPPAGFNTPFGAVGDGAAADNYGRYRLLIDGIIGMIPDTETSLAIKIPAQVLYMAYDFLGLCLEQAASDAASATLTSRHGLVVTAFADMNLFVSSQVTGLTSAYDVHTANILNRISAQSNAIQQATTNHSTVIQGVVNTEAGEMQTLIDTEGQSIKDLIQSSSDQTQSDLDAFRKLNLKLTIERVLQAGANSEMALFQLRSPYGHLDLVRDIVRDTISAMDAHGEGSGQAQRIFEGAVALMGQGKDKDAFKEFARAYQQATR